MFYAFKVGFGGHPVFHAFKVGFGGHPVFHAFKVGFGGHPVFYAFKVGFGGHPVCYAFKVGHPVCYAFKVGHPVCYAFKVGFGGHPLLDGRKLRLQAIEIGLQFMVHGATAPLSASPSSAERLSVPSDDSDVGVTIAPYGRPTTSSDGGT